MSDYGIIILFGVVIVLLLASRIFFRRHALGMGQRIALSVLALFLSLAGVLREGQIGAEEVLLACAVGAVLGTAIVYLWRSRRKPPG